MNEDLIYIEGPQGQLESLVAEHPNAQGLAIICHPHPLYQGTMQNKVVRTLVKTFYEKNLTTIRFNYRGVGKSEGAYGNSLGEAEDLMAIIAWSKKSWSDLPLYLAGFSFGAYIAILGAQQVNCQQLFSIAPSVENQPYAQLPAINCSWVVIQPEKDEVVNPEKVYVWVRQAKHINPQIELHVLPKASHFFHGDLPTLSELVQTSLR